MTKNPILNSIIALLYIVIVASIIYYGPRLLGAGEEDTVLAPIAVISLFTLSAAVMGYVFLYYPLQMFLEGEKKQAINLFLRTLAMFGIITAIVLFVAFSI